MSARPLAIALTLAVGLAWLASCVGDDPDAVDAAGAAGAACFRNGTCNAGLACVGGTCEASGEGGATTSSSSGSTSGTTASSSSGSTSGGIADDGGGGSTSSGAIDSGSGGGDAGGGSCSLGARVALRVDLKGASVVAPDLQANASGTALFTFDPATKRFCGTVTYMPAGTPVMLSHLHLGAAGEPSKGIVESFGGGATPIEIDVLSPSALDTKACNGSLYFDLHVAGGGSIRGQLLFDPGRTPAACP